MTSPYTLRDLPHDLHELYGACLAAKELRDEKGPQFLATVTISLGVYDQLMTARGVCRDIDDHFSLVKTAHGVAEALHGVIFYVDQQDDPVRLVER